MDISLSHFIFPYFEILFYVYVFYLYIFVRIPCTYLMPLEANKVWKLQKLELKVVVNYSGYWAQTWFLWKSKSAPLIHWAGFPPSPLFLSEYLLAASGHANHKNQGFCVLFLIRVGVLVESSGSWRQGTVVLKVWVVILGVVLGGCTWRGVLCPQPLTVPSEVHAIQNPFTQARAQLFNM